MTRSLCSPSSKPSSLHKGTRVWNPLAEKAEPSPTTKPSISTENFAWPVPRSPKNATACPASTQAKRNTRQPLNESTERGKHAM